MTAGSPELLNIFCYKHIAINDWLITYQHLPCPIAIVYSTSTAQISALTISCCSVAGTVLCHGEGGRAS